MKYNFDEKIERKNTDCLKYDILLERFGASDIIPLWVADMDFRVCPEITYRFSQIVKLGIYGYHLHSEKYFDAIINWLFTQHQMKVDKQEICFTPGVVPAISYIIQALTKKGDGVLVQSPVYYPFFSVVKHNERQLFINQLIEKDNSYSVDFDDFEQKAKQSKMFILCSPHNPVGRVWRKDELQKMTDICLKYNVLIVSDEIHNDLVFEGYKHIPTSTLSEEVKQNTITCHSASKTFNLAGLSTAYIIISNPTLRSNFKKYYSNLHTDALNIFGLEAMAVAYTQGNSWHKELIKYLWDNYQFLVNYINQNVPTIKVTPLEATYLVWLDFRAYKLSDTELKQLIIEKAKLGLNDGPTFGIGGSGFQRINIACPRSVLVEAMERLRNTFIK
jgi:cysteine-S-conjugate beta-lyase